MRVEIFADTVCPWCYRGKRRLERALAARPDLAVELSWLPFFILDRVAGRTDG